MTILSDQRFADLYRYLDMRFDIIDRRLSALENKINALDSLVKNHGEWMSRYAYVKSNNENPNETVYPE